VLLEDVAVVDNGGFGVKVGCTENLTIRRCRFSRNGHSGMNTGTCLNTLVEDVDTSYNNWRGHLGGLYGWAVGGIKAHEMRDAIFRDVRAHGNLTHALWFDISNTNVTIERFTSVGNLSGLFFEISPGPFAVRDALIAFSTGQSVILTNAAHVSLRDTMVYDGAEMLVGVTTNRDRSGGNLIGATRFGEPWTVTYRQGATTFENCVFVNRHKDAPLVQLTPADPALYREWYTAMLNSRNNAWLSPMDKPFGVGYVRSEMADFAGWRKASGQETGSVWADPGFVAPNRLDFRLKPDSPLKGRPQPAARKLDPAILDRVRAWNALWGYAGRGDYDENPLRAAKAE
jgi:hypothetical protein